ncbi:unnamed protein product [Albugo candida]|uniref:Uncharacterized protein n=1 Tax=Albugo candida TaxID=65357 RepID=A0A024GBF0_9STRA|nr:unnamed protein product [Albugo candida]|eukprot:CCI43850.1 unnamed protein product [Albugo candida]
MSSCRAPWRRRRLNSEAPLKKSVYSKLNVQELLNQLEVSRQRNRICQCKLDYAYKSHEKDGDRLKELTEGHTILKEELSRSKAMLDGFKVFMEQQQEQLIELKHAGDLKTSELTETQTALMDKMELRHRQQHQRSQERIERLEQANMECNAKAVKYYTILQDLKAYMKDELIYSEAFKETKDNNRSSAVQHQTAGNRSSYQEAAVHDRQAYIGYDLIASFKIHVSILQMKLQNFEYKIEAQRKQLERISTGHERTQNS